MKLARISLCLYLLLSINNTIIAQDSGHVTYKFNLKMFKAGFSSKQMNYALMEDYSQEFEDNNTSFGHLYFKARKSFYFVSESESKPTHMTSITGASEATHKVVSNGNSDAYTDLAKNEVILYKMDDYAIKDSLSFSKAKWKETLHEKTILGYKCKNVILKEEQTIKTIINGKPIEKKVAFTTSVWYSKDLNSSFGPLEFSGFPGLVLEVETEAFKISASEIDLKFDVKKDIKPLEGYKIIGKDKLIELMLKKI